MDFNFPKFECLRYGRNNELKSSTHYFSKSGEVIRDVQHAKDLGVVMSSDGSFSKHISSVIETAKQMSGWVLRTFRTRDRTPMLSLWKSLIRSKLEYCCQLWCPSKTGDIQNIEQVQRNFIRKISGVQHLTYWQQLQKLSMYSLERRRDRYMAIYVWRILEGQVPNFADPNNGGIRALWHARRGRSCAVPVVSCQAAASIQKLRYNSFGILGPRLFNSLPAEIRNVTECSADTFKRVLDKYLATVPDEPQVRGYTAMRRADSNSVLHMAQFATSQPRAELVGPGYMPDARGGHPWSPWE